MYSWKKLSKAVLYKSVLLHSVFITYFGTSERYCGILITTQKIQIMKFIILLVAFFAISEARSNERIGEDIKSRYNQLDYFLADTTKIIRNFITTIENNIALIENKNEEIKKNQRIQGDRLKHCLKIEKSLDASDAKKKIQELINNIQVVNNLIPTNLHSLNDQLENITTNFTAEIEDNVALWDNEIEKCVKKNFLNSSSEEIMTKVRPIINKKKNSSIRIKERLQRQAEYCHQEADRYIENIKRRMNNLITKIGNANMLGKLLNMNPHDEDIEDAINDFNEEIKDEIDDQRTEIQDIMNDLLSTNEDCFIEKLNEAKEDFRIEFEEMVGDINEIMPAAILDRIYMEIGQRFGISEEARRPPSSVSTAVIESDHTRKTFICSGQLSFINSSNVTCKTRSGYYQEIVDQKVNGFVFHSEEYLKPEAKTLNGFMYTIDLNNPNSTLHIEAKSRPYTTFN